MARTHHRVPETGSVAQRAERRAHNPERLRSNRSGTTMPRVAQWEERLPSKQEAARSNRGRGHHASLAGLVTAPG